MVTKNQEPLGDAQHHIEGEVIDLSEHGFRMRSTHILVEGEQISFEITSADKTLFRGVAEVKHCLPDEIYGMQYCKVKKAE